MFPSLIGTLVIAGIVGVMSERSGFTRNGLVPSVIICLGGAGLVYFVWVMFGFGFQRPGWNAIIAAIGALIIVPTRFRKR